MTKYIINAILLFCLIIQIIINNTDHAELERLKTNQESLLEERNDYRTLSDLQAQTINRLNLSIDELKKYNLDATKKIKDLRIKIKDVQAVADIADNSMYYFAPDTIRDTTIVIDTLTIHPTLYYNDKWITMALDTNGTVAISTRDTINIILHQRQKKFLWWRWRIGTPKATVSSRNPHHKIDAIQVIDIIDK